MIMLNSEERHKIQVIADNVRGLRFNLESIALDVAGRYSSVLESDWETNQVEVMNVRFLVSLISEKASDLERVAASIERLLLK